MNKIPQDPTPRPQRLLLPYQKKWTRDQARFKIGLWARQTGKSFACAAEAVMDCMRQPGTEWIILSAGERQALEFMRKARDWAGACGYAIDNYFETRAALGSLIKSAEITWSNGSRMIALPANPAAARGYSANLILDEFAFHERPEEIWRAIFPSISSPFGGQKKLRVVSTPNGLANKFHDLWSRGPNFSKHRITLRDAVAGGLRINLEELRDSLDDPDAWAQEYECEFIDNASLLLPYDLIAQCESPEASETCPPGFFHSSLVPRPSSLSLGIDVGRRRDLTVCWTLEHLGDVWWTREVLVLDNTPFHEQFHALLPRVRAAGRAAIDATGLGAMLAEELARHAPPGRVLPCPFTPTLKLELFPPLRRHFEDKTVRVPVSRAVREDLHGLQKVISNTGAIRYQALQSEDGHSDRATALALALHAGRHRQPPPHPPFAIRRGTLQHTRRDGMIHL
jgi:phage FluMu gp28-like protein